MNRRINTAIAALVFAAWPATAATPALTCADLSPESFTDAEFAALAEHAPVLHGYLASGSFDALDARQRSALVAQTTTGVDDGNDVVLPPVFVSMTGLPEERETMMDAYAQTCDIALGAFVAVLRTEAKAGNLMRLADMLYAQYEAQGNQPRCGRIARCSANFARCLDDAGEDRDLCMSYAEAEKDQSMAECRQEFDDNIAEGMNRHLAQLILTACTTGVVTQYSAEVTLCQGIYTADVAICEAVLAGCLVGIGDPY